MVKATLSRCYQVSLKSLLHNLSLDEWYREPTPTHGLHCPYTTQEAEPQSDQAHITLLLKVYRRFFYILISCRETRLAFPHLLCV